MLSDREIDDALHRLAEYRKQDFFSEMLELQESLLKEHKRLKSDLEEERNNREKYKQMARGQERNPFVLVLVDGDGYVFSEDAIKGGAEGGRQAADRLHSAINASLVKKGLDNCQVVVRVYADLVGLSKALSKVGLCGADKRSLAPFVASFNRSHGLTDFVDAGELKENADFKLRETLRLFADDARCKHIYFAACHDVGYVAELSQHRGAKAKLTLIRTSTLAASAQGVHREFEKLNLPIEELPGVFRSEPLVIRATGPTPPKTPSTPKAVHMPNNHTSPKPNVAPEQPKNCHFFATGYCKYGSSCRYHHPSNNHSRVNLSKSDNDFMNGLSTKAGKSPDGKYEAAYPDFTQLPRKEDVPDGHVALNGKGHRLDAYLKKPSREHVARIRARAKLCNNHHLANSCSNEPCEYDHSPLDEELKPALEALARMSPCSRRGFCRQPLCTHGHICQKSDCKHYGSGSKYCKISYMAHKESLSLDKTVEGVINEPGKRSTSTSESEGTVQESGQHSASAAESGEDSDKGSPAQEYRSAEEDLEDHWSM